MCLSMLGSLKEGITGTSEFQGTPWGEESSPGSSKPLLQPANHPGTSSPTPDLARTSYPLPGGSAQPTHPDLNSLMLGFRFGSHLSSRSHSQVTGTPRLL